MSLMGDITRYVKRRLKIRKLNKIIGRYRYVHFMFNDKFNKPFVDFLNNNFDKKEHLILCKRWFNQFPFPEGENVVEINTFEYLDFHQKNIEKLIFHSLFDEECIDLLYEQSDLLNKSYWAIWGGDLYGAKRDEKNDFVRSNFKGYSNKSDEDYAKLVYNIDKDFFDAYISFAHSYDMLDELKISPQFKQLRVIQINNSSDPSTIDMLKKLSFLANEDVEIRTIVSYGAVHCKDEIIKTGKEIFGNKFKYLDEYLLPENYVEYVSSCDILIMNQDRQQGGSTIFMFLYLYKKVFIKENVSTYKYLTNNNILIHNTYDIDNISVDDLFASDSIEILENNKRLIFNISSDTRRVEQWNLLFND